MSWTAEGMRRGVRGVFTGPRQFVLLREDGTEEANGVRVSGVLTEPELTAGAWRATNAELIEFPPFARTVPGSFAVAVAIYDGPQRLAIAPIAPVAISERVQVVLRPRDLWVGVAP